MKKIITVFFATTIMVCCAVKALSAEGPVIQDIKGKVEVKAPDSSEWAAAAAGAAVQEGTTLRTGIDSTCIVKWGGNVLKATPLTTTTIAEANIQSQISTLNLDSGKIMVHVDKLSTSKSSFQIKTPTAVAGVRGTDLFAQINPDSSATFGVTEGEIFVSVGDMILNVEQNLYVTVGSQGEMGTPEPIPENMRQEAVQEMKEVKKNVEAPKPAAQTREEPGKEQKQEEASGDKPVEEPASTETDMEDIEQIQADAVEDVIDSVLDDAETEEILKDIERVYREGSIDIDIYVEP